MTAQRPPGFLEEDDEGGRNTAPRPAAAQAAPRSTPVPSSERASPPLPRGPMLLEPESDAPDQVDVVWTPEAARAPPIKVGTAFWVAAGLAVLLLSWALLSIASFVAALLIQSLVLGLLGIAGVGLGFALLLTAVVVEVKAYRSLGTVERLRALLAARDTTPEVARLHALGWLRQVGAAVPRRTEAERMVREAGTVIEIRAVLRSKVADQLHQAALAMGRQAAMEGATLVAICPHPAWDGIIAGGRGLLVIRRVATLYGLRPSLTVTLALMRRMAWTAASTAGLDLVSQSVADHLLGSMPVLKHVASVLPGSGVVAVRLYRLAGITGEACSPVTTIT